MGTVAAIGLLLCSALQGTISVYFATLMCPLPAWLVRGLGRAAGACGIDGGSCRRVVQTPYARLFGGLPNVLVGIGWALLVIACAVVQLVTGTFPLWWLCATIAWASIAVGIYLSWVLFVKLRDPCPL